MRVSKGADENRIWYRLSLARDDFHFNATPTAGKPRLQIKQCGVDALKSLPFVLSEPVSSARIEEVGDSNIAIRFLGWIDQADADWFKSRSLAIAAVKEALESSGFAIPEPIYRLRVDSRSGALPIGRSAGTAEAIVSEAKPATQAPIDTDEDVRPESEIVEMVEKERAEDKKGRDLLDPNRPVE